MDYDELVTKVIELLQREKRVPYRALKRRFDLDDEYIEDLKDELIYAKKLAVDEENRVLVWVGEQATTPPQTPQQPTTQETPPTTERRYSSNPFQEAISGTPHRHGAGSDRARGFGSVCAGSDTVGPANAVRPRLVPWQYRFE